MSKRTEIVELKAGKKFWEDRARAEEKRVREWVVKADDRLDLVRDLLKLNGLLHTYTYENKWGSVELDERQLHHDLEAVSFEFKAKEARVRLGLTKEEDDV